jgi:hypothetical protein
VLDLVAEVAGLDCVLDGVPVVVPGVVPEPDELGDVLGAPDVQPAHSTSRQPRTP